MILSMNLPLLLKLKDGEKFDFGTISDNIEQADEYWDWWWSEKAGDRSEIRRPEIISDDDPILLDTSKKASVDFTVCSEFFDRHLLRAIQTGWLPSSSTFSRPAFHEQLLRLLKGCSIKLPNRPELVFSGGGYGSGKTTNIQRLAEAFKLPVEIQHSVGVDSFKPFVPEYNLIKAVGDGRASSTVQNECREIANRLFGELVSSRRSFMWDSSMSEKAQTMEKIEQAQEQGYRLTMIAVLTPVSIAIQQAMRRAMLSRRFPSKIALPASHDGFRKAMLEYMPHFDCVTVFANRVNGDDGVIVVAEKDAPNDLAIYDKELFDAAMLP